MVRKKDSFYVRHRTSVGLFTALVFGYGYCYRKAKLRKIDLRHEYSDKRRGNGPIHPEKLGWCLNQVHVFARHGARTPLHEIPGIPRAVYPLDIEADLPDWPQVEWEKLYSPVDENNFAKPILVGGARQGQLTRLGTEQSQELGRKLRERYVKQLAFVPRTYNGEAYYFRSTNVRRTLLTVSWILKGLLEPAHDLANPIKIDTRPDETETIVPNWSRSALHEHLEHASIDDPDIIDLRTKMAQAIRPFCDAKGIDCPSQLNAVAARDDLVARTTHNCASEPAPNGRPSPPVIDCLRPFFDGKLDSVAAAVFAFDLGLPDTRLVVGPLLGMVWQRTVDIAGDPDSVIPDQLDFLRKPSPKLANPRFNIYGVHDSTLLPLLMVFDGFTPGDAWPPFAAAVVVELWQEPMASIDQEGRFFVRVLYDDATPNPPKILGVWTHRAFKTLVEPHMLTEKKYFRALKSPWYRKWLGLKPLPIPLPPPDPAGVADPTGRDDEIPPPQETTQKSNNQSKDQYR